MPSPEPFLGPFGALLLALFVLGIAGKAIAELWGEHKASDADDRAQRDRALALVEGLIPTVRELAEAQKAANRDAEHRHRKGDEP